MKWLPMVAVAATILTAVPAWAQDGWVVRMNDIFIGQIEFRDDDGIFRINITHPSYGLPERENYFRLWGANVTDQEGLLSLLDGPVTCRPIGFVYAESHGRLLIADCRVGDPMVQPIGEDATVSRMAVEAGYAIEICAETGGELRHCPP